MDVTTRRKFLIASGVAGAGALAVGGLGAYTLTDLFDTRIGGGLPADAGVLVLITLYGGNDGLATVVPYGDPAYTSARGELALPADQVLHLDETLGLSPSLTGFKRLYDQGTLAVVRGVGYPKPDRSHFRSMDIWQTAQPDRPGTTGWLGRWLDTVPNGDPRYAVTFEPVLPPLLAGNTTAGAAVTTNGLRLPNGYEQATLVQLGRAVDGEPPLQARAAHAFADLVEVDQMVKSIPASPDADPGQADPPAATATGGKAALTAQLQLIARCIEGGVATRAYSASLGGFDLHAPGRQAQLNLLSDLDKAVTGFADRMAKSATGRRVVIAIYSEFGRRVRANASEGTDHGTASDMFVLGVPVKGGLYGAQPSLTDLDDGDLKYTTDFRDVYATLLGKVLAADPTRILGGWKTS